MSLTSAGVAHHLRPAPIHDVTPAFVLWLDIDEDAFSNLVSDLEVADFMVINDFDYRPADDIGLRDHLQSLAAAHTFVMPDTWWTSLVGQQLVQVASWLGMEFMDYEGTPIEKVTSRV